MDNVTTPLKLTRKITSTIGIADVVLLKRAAARPNRSRPATGRCRPWRRPTLIYVVPPESEGFPAGATINASPLP